MLDQDGEAFFSLSLENNPHPPPPVRAKIGKQSGVIRGTKQKIPEKRKEEKKEEEKEQVIPAGDYIKE